MAGNDMAAQIAADEEAVEALRQKCGDEAAAKFAAELYKIRRTPQPQTLMSTFPRWIIILIAVWVALLETADKLPQLFLTLPKYDAAVAEYKAKLVQPELADAQLVKAQNDAKASAVQPDMSSAQLIKAKNDAKASIFQPDLAEVQLDKTKADLKGARWQPYLAYTQAQAARTQWLSAGPNDAYQNDYARHLVRLEPYGE